MAYDDTYQRLITERMAAGAATREMEKLRGKFDPYTLMLAGKERALSEQIDSIRVGERDTQKQDLKDYAQREANMNWCIQQTLLTGGCPGYGEFTGTAQCEAYRKEIVLSDHLHAYSAGLTAWPKTKYPPYSKPFNAHRRSAILSPESSLAAVPPFVVEGSRVPVGAGCPFASPRSTATSTGFIANATFTPGTNAAANARGAAAAIAAVQAAANAANLSKENADILIKRMTDAIGKRNLNKKPPTKPTGRKGAGKKGLTKLKGK